MRINRLAMAVIADCAGFTAGFAHGAPVGQKQFFLKAGDRVCFYGDSITEQRYYGVDTETYAVTRFPDMQVMFVNSGVGGDKVGGGWAGPIDVRLKRDVYPFKPNIVTIMLGMNDAGVRPFSRPIFNVYRKGYIHIVNELKKHLPGVKIVLIQPSPFDDVSHKIMFPGGYNAVLLKYAAFVKRLAARDHLMCVNFNRPLVNVIKGLMKISTPLAPYFIPGRVHPSATGQLIMAATLLKAWHATPVVSSVDINGGRLISSKNTRVQHLTGNNGLQWTQTDQSLPMPMMTLHENWPKFPPMRLWPAPTPNFAYKNPLASTVIKLTHLYRKLDRETLRVRDLTAGHYQLKINGQLVGTFSTGQLSHGINLAKYETPMLVQAYHVQDMLWHLTEERFFAWRHIQLPIDLTYRVPWNRTRLTRVGSYSAIKKIDDLADKLVSAIYATFPAYRNEIYKTAQPVPDHYSLTRVN
jgi:lysophospholipase L1-like esterase